MVRVGLPFPVARAKRLMIATVFAASVLLIALSLLSAQNPAPSKSDEILSSPPAANNEPASTAVHPKGDTKLTNLDKTKMDAERLSTLANQLRDELKGMNPNILSLDVLQKTEELEKLAKKIRGEANGY